MFRLPPEPYRIKMIEPIHLEALQVIQRIPTHANGIIPNPVARRELENHRS